MVRRIGRLAILALASVVAMGCSSERSKSLADEMRASAGADEFKIGIMTGAVARHEAEFRAARQLVLKYGSRVRHITYPDDFQQEQETVTAQLTGLAADPEIKIIVVGAAVPGSVEAARRIRAQRPDVLIGFVDPLEDPAAVGAVCDVAVSSDVTGRGPAIISEAHAMGATAFVHYATPSQMSDATLARQRELMRTEAIKRGIAFEAVDAPEPPNVADTRATEQFLLTDMPKQLERYGPNTCFFSTDPDAQEPMIRQVLEHGGFVAEPSDASPLRGYPDAFGISIPGNRAGDAAFVNAANRRAAAEHGMSGHFGAWSAPGIMVALRAVTNLLVDAADKRADVHDPAAVLHYLREEAGTGVRIRKPNERSGNQYLMMLDQVVY